MSTFQTSREMAAAPEKVFAAFTDADRMARWWGPAGFTNTFKVREFMTGGKWSYFMHGPKGATYPNESIFEEVSSSKVVIQHNSEPRYKLTIELMPSAKGTMVTWVQVFEKADVAERIAHIVAPANEQNLDRLTAEVLKK